MTDFVNGDQAMDEADGLDYAPEDYLDLLRSNTLALALGTISFLRKRGIPASEWTNELGSAFARGWDTDQPWTPEEFLDATLVNLAAFGGEATQAEFAEDSATALIRNFPALERLEGMGLEHVNGDILFDLITPIAEACGVRWTWERAGDGVRVQVVPVGDGQ